MVSRAPPVGGVAAGLDEAEKPGGADGGGGTVVERMTIEAVGLHHLGIEDDGDAPGGVVDQREGDRTGLDPQHLAQEVGAGNDSRAEPIRVGRVLSSMARSSGHTISQS